MVSKDSNVHSYTILHVVRNGNHFRIFWIRMVNQNMDYLVYIDIFVDIRGRDFTQNIFSENLDFTSDDHFNTHNRRA